MAGESEPAIRRAGRLANGYIRGGGIKTRWERYLPRTGGWGLVI
jgi:hypothetical protein